MKKSMIVMMLVAMMFSVNLFAEQVNTEETKKECGSDCTKLCCADKAAVEKHECSEKCELVMNHVCTDECKLDEKTEKCEVAMLKDQCLTEAKKLGCKPEGCEQKVIKKGCHK